MDLKFFEYFGWISEKNFPRIDMQTVVVAYMVVLDREAGPVRPIRNKE